MTTPRVRRLLVAAVLTAAATLTVAGCSTDGGDSDVAAAQSAASRIAAAESSGAASASAADTSAPTSPDTGGSGSDDSGSPTGTGGGPCGLLTLQQVSSSQGATFDSAYVLSGDSSSPIGQCVYGSGTAQNLTVDIISGDHCWSALTSSNGPGTPISGVGDDAFGFTSGMDVQHGDTCIDIVGNTAAESSGNWGPDTTMAKIIVGKLG